MKVSSLKRRQKKSKIKQGGEEDEKGNNQKRIEIEKRWEITN